MTNPGVAITPDTLNIYGPLSLCKRYQTRIGTLNPNVQVIMEYLTKTTLEELLNGPSCQGILQRFLTPKQVVTFCLRLLPTLTLTLFKRFISPGE